MLIKDHYIVLTGEKAGYLATSKNLKAGYKYITRDILLNLVHPPKGLIVEGSLTADEYMKTVANAEFKSASFFVEGVGKKIKSASKTGWLSRFLRKFFTDPDYPYPFYFIFADRDQMVKFIPLSSKYFLDSYYIYFIENEAALRQRILNSSKISVKDVLNLCYAIIPTQNCQANFCLNILSNFLTEEEFRAISELTLEEPAIRRLSDKENQDAQNIKLSCAIPLYNNPKAKLA